MARTIAGRLTIAGQLVTLTPLHVGGHGDDVDTDLPLARNWAGGLHVPGTSLAGAFRGWCDSAFGESRTHAVWGFQKDDEGFASYVHVEDATIANPDAVQVEIRDGVGIDREWGCAAEQIKYDRAVLPRGTSLSLAMTVEFHEAERDLAVAMFTSLVEALKTGDVRLGAAKTRGLGRIKLESAAVREHTLNTREGILALLRQRVGRDVAATAVDLARRPRLDMAIDWHPCGPLMVKAGADGIGVDSVPLVSGVDGRLTLVLPGSSVKGAIRNQAERIVRSLLGTPLSPESNARKRFLKHLEEVPLIEDVFGAPGKRRDEHARNNTADFLGLSAVSVDDCYGQPRFTREQWQAVITAGSDASPNRDQSDLRQALDAAALHDWTAAYHLAVDRWTGGAAESLLYTVLEPFGVVWEPIRLGIDLTRIRDERRLAAIALLLLVLRDMGQGRVPLGFATNRGMGAMAIDRVVVSGRDLDGNLAALHGCQLPGGDIARVPATCREALQAAWTGWLNANGRTEVTP